MSSQEIIWLCWATVFAIIALYNAYRRKCLDKENDKLKGYIKTLYGMPKAMEQIPKSFQGKIRRAIK